MKYLKVFEKHEDYEDYVDSQDYLAPNVSYCVDKNEVHYNPYIKPETRIITTYNVTNINEKTCIIGFDMDGPYYEYISKIEIDDTVVINNPVSNDYEYQFNTEGIHVIKYTLKDQTYLPKIFNRENGDLKTVTIPTIIETISGYAFSGCNLTSVTCNSVTPPILGNGSAFGDNKTLYPIYVPAESVNAYKSATNWATYASRIQAIPS